MVLAALLLATGLHAAARGASIYTVSNLPLDETSESAAAARDIALAKGQAQAFRRVVDRIVPISEQDRVPRPTPAVLLDIVSGIEVENEKTSPVRYLANLTVRFNKRAMRQFLRDAGVAFAETAGKPLLVLPVYRSAGTVQLWDAGNPWLQSWQSLPLQDGLLPLIVPEGDGADIAAVSADQALKGDQRRLRVIMNRYKAEGTILAVATLRRDDAQNTAFLDVALTRTDATGRESTSVSSFAANPGMTATALLENAARKLRDELLEGWKQDNLIRFGEKRELVAIVPLTGLAAWIDVRRRVSLVASVEKAELLSISLDQATVRFSYFGDEDQLALAFAEHDMELNQGPAAWQLRVGAGSRNGSTGPVSQP